MFCPLKLFACDQINIFMPKQVNELWTNNKTIMQANSKKMTGNSSLFGKNFHHPPPPVRRQNFFIPRLNNELSFPPLPPFDILSEIFVIGLWTIIFWYISDSK